jgi:hypothetical protein
MAMWKDMLDYFGHDVWSAEVIVETDGAVRLSVYPNHPEAGRPFPPAPPLPPIGEVLAKGWEKRSLWQARERANLAEHEAARQDLGALANELASQPDTAGEPVPAAEALAEARAAGNREGIEFAVALLDAIRPGEKPLMPREEIADRLRSIAAGLGRGGDVAKSFLADAHDAIREREKVIERQRKEIERLKRDTRADGYRQGLERAHELAREDWGQDYAKALREALTAELAVL